MPERKKEITETPGFSEQGTYIFHSPIAGTCRPGKISPMVENERLKEEPCSFPAQWEVPLRALLSWQREEALEKWPLSFAISTGEAVASLHFGFKRSD